ncbi:MAG: pseudouridine-5'-phosphate glycosidase [Acidimicrobiia bacterium]
MRDPSPARLVVQQDVADDLAAGRPVVALESTIVSHGLPRPDNLEVARRIEQAVRDGGARPATIAVVDGVACIGLDDDQLETIATADDVAKASARDLAVVAARGGHAATTVAATAHLAAEAGIAVFATGGLGGVHRGAAETFDESGDLTALSRLPITVVAAGVKSILDVAATLERLESLGVAVVGYGTDRFPGFYRRDSGFPVDWRVDSPEEVAAIMAARATLGTDGAALLVANPVAEDEQVDAELHDRVLAEGLAAAAAEGIRGKAVTPFLLERFHRETRGESLRSNIAIILANAHLAARIAAAAAPAGA